MLTAACATPTSRRRWPLSSADTTAVGGGTVAFRAGDVPDDPCGHDDGPPRCLLYGVAARGRATTTYVGDRYRPPHGWHVLPFATGHVGAAAPGAGDYIRSPFGHDGITQHCWTRGDVVAARSTTPCGVTKCFGSSTGRSGSVFT